MELLLLIGLILIVVAVLTTGPALRPRRRVIETVYEEPTVVSDTRGDPPLIDRRLLRRRRVG